MSTIGLILVFIGTVVLLRDVIVNYAALAYLPISEMHRTWIGVIFRFLGRIFGITKDTKTWDNCSNASAIKRITFLTGFSLIALGTLIQILASIV